MEDEERGSQGWLLRFSLEHPQMEVAINAAGGADLGGTWRTEFLTHFCSLPYDISRNLSGFVH